MLESFKNKIRIFLNFFKNILIIFLKKAENMTFINNITLRLDLIVHRFCFQNLAVICRAFEKSSKHLLDEFVSFISLPSALRASKTANLLD